VTLKPTRLPGMFNHGLFVRMQRQDPFRPPLPGSGRRKLEQGLGLPLTWVEGALKAEVTTEVMFAEMAEFTMTTTGTLLHLNKPVKVSMPSLGAPPRPPFLHQ
jgi:hypothetical protein